jgi:hypothetical protein
VLFCDLVNSTQHRRSLIVYWKVEDARMEVDNDYPNRRRQTEIPVQRVTSIAIGSGFTTHHESQTGFRSLPMFHLQRS